MVIKTVASFTARPLLWFSLLSLPMLFLGMATLAYTLVSPQPISLPIAGSGVILMASTFILVSAGAFGELVYKLGDMREHHFSCLTQRVSGHRSPSQIRNP
jgi:hypothetical protein